MWRWVITLAMVLAAPAPAAAALPGDFVGITSEDVYAAESEAYASAQLAAQRRAGITLARQELRWAELQPAPGRWEFTLADRYVRRAATAGIRVMPLLKGEPAWASSRPAGNTLRAEFPPRDLADYARYAQVIAQRYGRNGSFWAANPGIPRKPITRYQLWNEPNLPAYWGGRPNAKAYARMVKVTAAAIRAVDPKAYIVSAGIPDSKLGLSATWFIKRMLRHGAGLSLNAVAIHPYALRPSDVINTTRRMRRAMNVVGKNRRRDLWVTEIGWAAGGPWTKGRTVTTAQQGPRIVTTFRALAKRRKAWRVRGVVYYAWRDSEVYAGGREFWGLYTGLIDRSGHAKPSLQAVTASLPALR